MRSEDNNKVNVEEIEELSPRLSPPSASLSDFDLNVGSYPSSPSPSSSLSPLGMTNLGSTSESIL